MEIEVEAVCVLSKKMKLRASSGSLFSGAVQVYESEDPFCLIFVVSTLPNSSNDGTSSSNHYATSGGLSHSVRLDVYRDDLARELREWLDGKVVRNPAIVAPPRIEETISMFVRYGQTPSQTDLLTWILSRSEIVFGNHPRMVLGGTTEFTADTDTRNYSHSSGTGRPRHTGAGAGGSVVSDMDNYDKINLKQDFPKTAAEHARTGAEATKMKLRDSKKKGVTLHPDESQPETDAHSGTHSSTHANTLANSKTHTSTVSLKHSTDSLFQSKSAFKHDDEMKTLSTTHQLLGRSIALDSLDRNTVKGRSTSSRTYSTKTWSGDHYRLVTDITRARHDIESQMEERRKIMQEAKARQEQSTHKYSTIRNKVSESSSLNTWVTQANHELETYHRIQADIDVEMKRQRGRSQRAIEHTRWTIAPNGFVNRRGRYTKGPYLGQGPLPADATSGLRNSKMEETTRHYYWDSAGRRHERIDHGDDHTHNPMEIALEAIKRAAANISAFKLDLKVRY
jgi:hypothetical protein